MKVKFWGVRGSHPKTGKSNVEYGGNTACIEIISKAGDEYILDSGTGIIELGDNLMQRFKGKVKARVFISHDHWDHIQGFPFFVPAYVPGCKIDIYSGDKGLANKLKNQNITTDPTVTGLENILENEDEIVTNKNEKTNYTKRIFEGQQDVERGYFPVGVGCLGSELTFHDLAEYQILNDGLSVSYMRHKAHPQGMFSYKIQERDKTIVYTGDYEHDAGENDRKMTDWARNVDCLIIDGQYTPEEYESKKGWGHSQIQRVCEIAALANVKELYIIHHDPRHNDEFLRQMEDRTKKYMKEKVGNDIPVYFAREGSELQIGE